MSDGNKDDLFAALAGGANELSASVHALVEKNGATAVMFALSSNNCAKLMRMMNEAGAPEALTYLVDRQFKMLLTAWGAAAKLDTKQVERLAQGLREQLATIEQDLDEISAAGGPTTKEN